MDRWDEMSASLKAMLKLSSRPGIYHYLAVAEAKGKSDYLLDDASKEIIKGYLSKATSTSTR